MTDTYSASIFDPGFYAGSDQDQDRSLRARLSEARAPQSEPIPKIAHGSIPGLLGIALNDQLRAVQPSMDAGPSRDAQGRLAPQQARPAGLLPGANGGPLMPVPIPPAAMGGGPVPPLPPPRNIAPPVGANIQSPPLAVPPNAMGSVAPAQPAPAAQSLQSDNSLLPKGSLLERLFSGANNWRDQNRLTLLALAGGLAGAPSIGTGIGRAFQAAVPAQQADIALNQQNQTARALVAKGLSPADAMVAAQNPAILQQILPRMFGAKQWRITETTDAFGQKRPILYDDVTGETKALDLSGAGSGGGAMGAANAAAAAAGGAPSRPTLENFDLSKINHNVQGWDYLKQYPVEVEDAARAYMSGGVMPTGNPRQQGIATMAKTVAQKVAMDLGEPNLADDTTFPARREMRVNLARGTPGSLGGQITFGGTSLGHLADVSEKAVALGNVNGLGIAPIARYANMVRGLSTDQAEKVNDVNGAIQHYGQEITKFYTGSPGGEAERMRFLHTMDTAKSSKEIAGAIRAERDLIPDRLIQLHSQIAERLGQKEADKQLSRVNLSAVTGRINAALAKLDPDGPEAKMLGGATSAAESKGAPAPPKVGEVRDGYRFKGGNPADPHNWEPVK